VGRNKSGTYYYLEFMSKSKEWLEGIAKFLEALSGKLPKIKKVKKNKTYWRLRLRDKKFVSNLLRISKFKSPQSKWNFTPTLNKDGEILYLSGFFDAEGYVSKSETTNAWNIGIEHTGNKSCPPLSFLKSILNKFGISSNAITKKTKNRKTPLFRLRITDKKSIIKFCKIIKSQHP
jgi:DNA-binding transcriptional regulator WhiA